MAQHKTQNDYRRNMNPKDQFGRKWLMSIELATGDPTGAIIPAGFADPLRTPIKFLRVPRNADNQAEIGQIRVDFDRWIAEVEEDERNWYAQLHENALHVYKRGSIEPKDVGTLDQDTFLIDLTGPKPFPSSEVLKMAQKGDRALLGLAPLTAKERSLLRMPTLTDLKEGGTVVEDHTPPADDSAPPEKYQDFVSWYFKTSGKRDLKAAAEAWKEHRALLAEV